MDRAASNRSGEGRVDVKRLEVWQRAMQPCRDVYLETRAMPTDERFGLTSQMRRASVSIPSNLAEGYGRASRGDYQRFVRMSRGSAYELETQLILATELGLLGEDAGARLLHDVQVVLRMLTGLMRSLEL